MFHILFLTSFAWLTGSVAVCLAIGFGLNAWDRWVFRMRVRRSVERIRARRAEKMTSVYGRHL